MDKYYYTTNQKTTVLNKHGLATAGELNEGTNTQLDGMYYENEDIILLWLGKLQRPQPVNEDGAPVDGATAEYKQGGANHFNVRFKGEPLTTPTGITEVEPETPDFVFA